MRNLKLKKKVLRNVFIFILTKYNLIYFTHVLGRRCCARMVVEFTTTYAISASYQ